MEYNPAQIPKTESFLYHGRVNKVSYILKGKYILFFLKKKKYN
jgi:hypothetical protein